MPLNIASLKISSFQILEIFLGVLLLAICVQITVPINPVPITMQSVAVLFIGLCYNKINAPLSILTYLLLGLIGMPIFANFSYGINGFTGPTGGYRIGFLMAVCFMSFLKGKFFNNSRLIEQLFLCLIGNIIIMGCGYLWLAKLSTMSQAFYVGVLPFIIPGIIKSLLLIALIRVVKPLW